MQSGDRDQVADAGAVEQLPLLVGNRALVSDRQCGDDSRVAAALESPQDPRAYRLAGARNIVGGARGECIDAAIVIVRAHIAGRAKFVLKKPRLDVETMRVNGAMRPLEPHGEGPALAGMDLGDRGLCALLCVLLCALLCGLLCSVLRPISRPPVVPGERQA